MVARSIPTRSRIALAVAALVVALPRIAEACAVCFTGRSDETRQAFISTTVFMTGLPLLLIGGVIWWLRRRTLQLEAAYQQAQTAAAPPAASKPEDVLAVR